MDEERQSLAPHEAFTSSQAFRVTVMVLLAVQNASSVLFMRKSRETLGVDANGQPVMWNPQTGVILQEATKLLLCLVAALCSGERPGAIVGGVYEVLRSGVPALDFLLQSNLQYVAISYMDAASFTAIAQLKILAGALFTVLILRRGVGLLRWMALSGLVVGVILVERSGEAQSSGGEATDFSRYLLGMFLMIINAMLSGFAGVYTELVLKGSDLSLWSRNVHFSAYGICLGLIGLALTGDFHSALAGGQFFDGYTRWSVYIILIQAAGGMLVSIVTKYVDNIAKNICAVVGLVLTVLGSVHWMGRPVDSLLVVGVSIISASVLAYNLLPNLQLGGREVSKAVLCSRRPDAMGLLAAFISVLSCLALVLSDLQFDEGGRLTFPVAIQDLSRRQLPGSLER